MFIDLTEKQNNRLSEFFANFSVACFTAATIAPGIPAEEGSYLGFVLLLKFVVSGILALYLSLKILEVKAYD